MAHEEGWPLGLGALNVRAGAMGSVDLSSSFSTAFTSSRCASSLASSDFDAESVWSLSRRGGGGAGSGMTLASLIGLVDAMESRRRRSPRASRSGGKVRALLLSLCLRSHLGNGSGGAAAPSLGQFLEMERRVSSS